MGNETDTQSQPQTGGIKWGDPIDEARKQQLWTRLRAWWDETDHGAQKGPFAGESLTGADVFWLAACTLSDQEMALDQAVQLLRDRSLDVHLSKLALQGASLIRA